MTLVVAYAAFVAVASFSVGYWAGARTYPQASPTVLPSSPKSSQKTPESDTDGNESDDSDHSSTADGDISSLRVDASDICKMVRRCLSGEIRVLHAHSVTSVG